MNAPSRRMGFAHGPTPRLRNSAAGKLADLFFPAWPHDRHPRPHRHHHLGHSALGQLRRRDPPNRRRQPHARHPELLFSGRYARAHQGAGSGQSAALHAGYRRQLAGLRAGAGQRPGVVLPAERDHRNSGAHLVSDLRGRQGHPQPRPRLQGRGRQKPYRGRGRRQRHQRRPVHVSGADGRRYSGVQRAQGAGGPRPDPAHRDGARFRAAFQSSVRRSSGAAGSRGGRARFNPARPRRPQDVEKLRQHHSAVLFARATEETDLLHRHRLARAGRSERHRRLGPVSALSGLRQRR